MANGDRVLVTGGCGYKGSVLVPKLLAQGYRVRVVDAQWFGNHLPPHPGLEVIRADVREIGPEHVDGCAAVIHLASIANDPAGDLNAGLTWETSCMSSMRLAEACLAAGVGRFVYASSGSVYGVKTEDRVTEDLPLTPISTYNKAKMATERILLSYGPALGLVIVRPATVCGMSPRMRLDVSVNMLTFQALENRRITVFGGDQVRPNIHIDDITDLYLFLLDGPGARLSGIYNAGFENISIGDLAARIAARIPSEVVYTESNDPRSYRQDSQKLLATGFRPRKGVSDAIEEIRAAYAAGTLVDRPEWRTTSHMRRMGIGQ